MERHLKERLIGAAVLVAAAVILIPEMLSGRRDSPDEEVAVTLPGGDAPLKTYTIDLNKGPGQSASAPIEEPTTAAPPPESAPVESESPMHETQAIPESVVTDPEPAPAPAPAQSHAAEADAPAPAPSHSAPVQPAPVAVPPAARSSGNWAVQLGSFSSQSKAQGMAGDLRKEGYEAFVMPVSSGGNTLYRVRIGPMADRNAAQGVQNKVKSKVPAAAVVKHP